jgi:phage terminase small subunit
MAKKLTKKQEIFVAEYLTDLNATRAYIAAGYSENGAEVGASNLLRNIKVAEEVNKKTGKRLEKLEITADKVLQEIAKMGFANMLDYMNVEDGRITEFDYSKLTRDQAAAIQEITMDTTGGAGDGERRLVLRTRFKLGDKRGSLELLGKHLKLFTDKVENTGPNGGPIQTSIEVKFIEADGK